MENNFELLTGHQIASALELQGIIKPTAIQEKAIPVILSGKDVAAISETGSGKTLTYLAPIFKKIDFDIKSPQVFIITPTHELAAQVYKHANILAGNLSIQTAKTIKSALIIGGASISRQIECLKDKPHIIIGSVGRIIELAKMKKLSAHFVKTIVLDEADRLVDENNYAQTETLIKLPLRDRQVLAFTASFNQKAYESLKKLTNNTDIVVVNTIAGTKAVLPQNLEHIYFYAEKRDKIKLLRKIVHNNEVKKAIIFINNPFDINDITGRLNYHGLKAAPLYGAALKNKRRLAVKGFRDGRSNLLVASDMAARGLDITGISHIINLEAPEETKDYQHRAGRAGRMGAKGTVITIVNSYEKSFLLKYEKTFGIKIIQKAMSNGRFADI